MHVISVIIPVYNAEDYIEKAIKSALIQEEVGEVIVVDDGSTDDSLAFCIELAKKDDRIQIYQHADKKNHGRSASRNLGILNAKKNYIAFLDADDYYLPLRFKSDMKALREKEIDGVYNAISAHYYDSYEGEKMAWLNLTTLSEKIPPENLFENMSPIGIKGWFHADGLTVKKLVFDKTGLFDESLKVAEDTHMWSKMALTCSLSPGIIDKPVAMRGIHNMNIIFDKILYRQEKEKMYKSLLDFACSVQADKNRIALIKKRKRRYINKSYKIKLAEVLKKAGLLKAT
jgi:glycosyltransferase involved in cell wall biosynthesis